MIIKGVTEIGKYRIKFAASMSCADLKDLGNEVKRLEEAKIDILHFDICDGHFALTFLFSPIIIKSLRPVTDLRFDAHLYTEYPSRYFKELYGAGVDVIIVHAEAKEDYKENIRSLSDMGIGPGLALLPGTGVPDDIEDDLGKLSLIIANTVGPAYSGQKFDQQGLDNIRRLKSIINKDKYHIDIGGDGSINPDTVNKVVQAGANVLTLGSSSIFYGKRDYKKNVNKLVKIIDQEEGS